jgi:hypothetical protein
MGFARQERKNWSNLRSFFCKLQEKNPCCKNLSSWRYPYQRLRLGRPLLSLTHHVRQDNASMATAVNQLIAATTMDVLY